MTFEQILAICATILASAAPLVFAALGETLSERAGVVNLSLDGTMLLAAMTAFAVGLNSGSVVLGLLAVAATGWAWLDPVMGLVGTVLVNKDRIVDRVDPRAEWQQIFHEVWRRYRDFFYVANMHGVDWPAMRDKYAALLPHVRHRNDLTYLIGEMIAELNVGHAYVGGGERANEAPRVRTGLLGAEFSRDPATRAYRIDRILRGENWQDGGRSPLTELGVDVKEGDYILAVDGQAPSDGRLDLLHGFGPVQVRLGAAQGRTGFVQFSRTVFPVVDRFVPTADELAGILSLERRALGERDLQALLVACERPYLILPVRSLDALTAARFDAAAWAASHAPSMLAQELLLFCRQTESPQANFHARLIGPDIAPREDPPIGAALPAFAAYLAAQPNLRAGTHTFTVERGFDATRKSLLQAEFDKRAGGGLTLRVGGQVVPMIQGTLSVPD